MSSRRRRVGMATLLLTVLVAQTALFPHLRLFGVIPDLMVVAVVAVAARQGPEVGAVFGFTGGVLVDLFLETPVGLSALAYALVGYGVGLVQSGLLRERWWLAPLLGGLGSLGGGLVFVTVGALVGQEYLVSTRTFLILPTRALYDAALAVGAFPLAGALLGRREESSLIPRDVR